MTAELSSTPRVLSLTQLHVLSRLPEPTKLLQRLAEAGYAATLTSPVNTRFSLLDSHAYRLCKRGYALARYDKNLMCTLESPQGSVFECELGSGAELECPGVEELEKLLKGRNLLSLLHVRATETRYQLQHREASCLELGIGTWTVQAPWSSSARAHLNVVAVVADTLEHTHVAAFVSQLFGAHILEPVEHHALSIGLHALDLPMLGDDLALDLVTGDDNVQSFVKKTIAAQRHILEASLPAVIADIDIEYLHDFRVACRRLRAFLQLFNQNFGNKAWRQLTRDLRWLGRHTGPVRDADVFLPVLRAELTRLSAPDVLAKAMCKRLLRRRDKQQQKLCSVLKSHRVLRMLRLLNGFEACLGEKHADGLDQPAAHIVGSHLQTALLSANAALSRYHQDIDDSGMHALRIEFKKLRYTIECLMPFFADKLKPLQKKLTAAQEFLGLHQDAVVAVSRLRELVRKDVQKSRRDEELLLVGAMTYNTQQQRQLQRQEFSRQAPLLADEIAALTRDMFGNDESCA